MFSLKDIKSELLQVIKKRRIVLASVLKPIDDTRMLEKLGATLTQSGEYEVTIIGYPSIAGSLDSKIPLIPLKPFTRFSVERLLVPWRIFRLINQVKPEIIVINTPELLLMSIFQKIFFGRKVIYDVLENYYRNVRYSNAYAVALRPVLSLFVRGIELLTKPFISLFILAEKGYEEELDFVNPHVVAENKLPQLMANRYSKGQKKGYHRLIFSGTLAPTTGILETIEHAKKLHAIDQYYSLTIIGYCALEKFLEQIKDEISGCDFIQLIGGSSLVPHSQILEEICKADVGFAIYKINLSTESSIPTKLYEYLALRLPTLISHNIQSHELLTRLRAGIILPLCPNYDQLNDQLKQLELPLTDPDLFWDQEGERVLNALKLL